MAKVADIAANQALHRTAFPLRFKAASELRRYVKKYTLTTSICANIILMKPMCEVKR